MKLPVALVMIAALGCGASAQPAGSGAQSPLDSPVNNPAGATPLKASPCLPDMTMRAGTCTDMIRRPSGSHGTPGRHLAVHPAPHKRG